MKRRTIRTVAIGALLAPVAIITAQHARRKPTAAAFHPEYRPQLVQNTNTSLEGGSPSTPSVRAENPVVNWLNAASTVVMALAIVATLLVSYATYRAQQDERSAGIETATQTAKIAFASKVVFWWDQEAKGKAVIVNVQNDNPLPVDAWVVYIPNYHSAAQPTGLTALRKPAGGVAETVTDFIGQIPPCTIVRVRSPFQHWSRDEVWPMRPSAAEGDLVFFDPSGILWERHINGVIGSKLAPPNNGTVWNGIGGTSDAVPWFASSASPVCG